ncbi:FHA domain-containing protein [Rhizobium deserti]|uniref:FHA domain-containing protein n=1 Tax=Rhizobium deserti TaxID=2547961 RepID=A0A4R5UP21_9HYPH|nr:FHA domain-containing protein [Rhizobium deserti]TDK39697.1 FHA domain-containing protein [Rhizobium deserti]
MRLELRQVGSDAAPAGATRKWYFEKGRRTLGRASDCDWQLPEDQRAVSKLHCIIERDSNGFVLLDKSANGSKVDGVVVHEGETARLSDRSRLEFGGLTFSVSISGERARDAEDPDASLALSDEPLTISAILADISSGGSSASGILGERQVEEWSMSAKGVVPDRDRSRQGAPSSRNVEIGWGGPPQLESPTKLLPDDWYTDGESNLGSHLEHGSATHVSIPISRPRPATPIADAADDVPAKETGPEADIDVEAFAELPAAPSSQLADRMEAVIARLEEAMEATFQVFDMEPPNPDNEPDLFGRNRDDAILARAEALLTRQLRLASGLDALMREAGRMMEPRILEARVDAGARRLPWLRNRDYWQAYRLQFEKNGRPLSVREIFHMAMAGETALPQGKEGRHDDETH